jgi:mannosyltransferase OCH1-like enzyme
MRWRDVELYEGLENTEISKTNEYNYQKMKENAIIPLDIYQTWHTTKLPPKMSENVNNLKNKNPEFKHHLYDDNDCREFIEKNYDKDVLHAFDSLIPGAYKADLWRYCILYKNGGIYLDIKFNCEDNFKLIELTDKEYFVLDRPYIRTSENKINIEDEIEMINDKYYYKNVFNEINTDMWKNKEIGLYNALLICKPNNPILLECINSIVENVKQKNYDYNPLYVTGPGLLGEKYFKGNYYKIDNNIHLFHSLNGDYMLNRKKKILSLYPEYNIEQQKHQKKEHYYVLWNKKNIYNE